MASLKYSVRLVVLLVIFIIMENEGKLMDNEAPGPLKSEKEAERPAVTAFRAPRKMQLNRSKNVTVACDLDAEQQDLAGRFATLALRAHSAARSDCMRLGAALVNTLGDIARTAQSRHAVNAAAAAAEANKKRKLSKSQKAKLQAKQKTALAVKKKAAAVAAAAAAKMAATAS